MQDESQAVKQFATKAIFFYQLRALVSLVKEKYSGML